VGYCHCWLLCIAAAAAADGGHLFFVLLLCSCFSVLTSGMTALPPA
jgi:hypothetical protein